MFGDKINDLAQVEPKKYNFSFDLVQNQCQF